MRSFFFKPLLFNYWLPVWLKSKRRNPFLTGPDWLSSSFLHSPHCSAASLGFLSLLFSKMLGAGSPVSRRWPSVPSSTAEQSEAPSQTLLSTSRSPWGAALLDYPVFPPSLLSCLHSFLLRPEVTTMRCLLLPLWLTSPPAQSPPIRKKRASNKRKSKVAAVQQKWIDVSHCRSAKVRGKMAMLLSSDSSNTTGLGSCGRPVSTQTDKPKSHTQSKCNDH